MVEKHNYPKKSGNLWTVNLEFTKCSKYVKRKDKNNMKTKEFANQFGVSVEEMCGITELSRQGLNDIVSGKSQKPSKAKRIALYNLRDYAAIRRKQEIDKANEDYENRIKMAEIFYVNQNLREKLYE